jgi:hypothetical protein
VEVTVPYVKLKLTQTEKQIDSESPRELRRYSESLNKPQRYSESLNKPQGCQSWRRQVSIPYSMDVIEGRQVEGAWQWELLSDMLTSGGAYDFTLIDRSTNDTGLKSGIRHAYNTLMNDSQDSLCQTIVSAMNKNTTLQRFIIHTVLSEAAIRSRLSRCHDYERIKEMIKVASTQTPCYLMHSR